MYDITFIYCHYNSFILACPGKPELYFAIYPPITGLGFRKNQGSDRWPPPLWSVGTHSPLA